MAESGSHHKTVIFIGLMLGMLVAAVSQTIVSPAMPVIVAELGEIEHYSWIATSTLLVSAVTYPFGGQTSATYARWWVYKCGVLIFIVGLGLPRVVTSILWLGCVCTLPTFG